ncbi:MAG: zf-HC2 domain-containing protein [Firmicutes bacterium]|nr:zf-HC2 domain-containing protein [Bacillota bacterium]
MNCKDMKDRIPLMISYYIDREMPEHESEEFEKHLSECPSCWKMLEETRRIGGALVRTPRISGNPGETLDKMRQRKKWWNSPIPFRPRKWVYAGMFAALIALLFVNLIPPGYFDSKQVAVNQPSYTTSPGPGGKQSGIGPGLPFSGSGGNAASTPTPSPSDAEIRTAQASPEPGGIPDEDSVTYNIKLNESEYEVNISGQETQLVSLEIKEGDKEIWMDLEGTQPEKNSEK